MARFGRSFPVPTHRQQHFVAAAAGGTLKTAIGLARASIKTMISLAIATIKTVQGTLTP